jgi:hypothetical protein
MLYACAFSGRSFVLKEVVPAAPYAAIVPAEGASPATVLPLAGLRIV